MGLLIEVYKTWRNGRVSDSTLNGITSVADGLCIVNIAGPFVPSLAYPPAMLTAGKAPWTICIVPAMPDGNEGWTIDPRWWAFGGNYGATPDSRFNEACERILGHRFYGAVAIHDRHER